MTDVKLVYVAGKYTSEHAYQVDENIDKSKHLARQVSLLGALGVSPHCVSGHAGGIQDYDWWIAATLKLMLRCDAVLMMEGWRDSKGSCGEHEMAFRIGMPVFYTLDEVKYWLEDLKAEEECPF